MFLHDYYLLRFCGFWVMVILGFIKDLGVHIKERELTVRLRLFRLFAFFAGCPVKLLFQILNRFQSLSCELVGRIQGFLQGSDHPRLGFDRFFQLLHHIFQLPELEFPWVRSHVPFVLSILDPLYHMSADKTTGTELKTEIF